MGIHKDMDKDIRNPSISLYRSPSGTMLAQLFFIPAA
jgi:hypothetical protein